MPERIQPQKSSSPLRIQAPPEESLKEQPNKKLKMGYSLGIGRELNIDTQPSNDNENTRSLPPNTLLNRGS